VKRPALVRGERPGEYWAHFASGAAMQLRVDRVRRYPGLVAPAPDNTQLYQRILEQLPGGVRAIDVGTGAGIGAAALLSRYDHVVGVDTDGGALAYAKELVHRASFVRADAEFGTLLPDAEAVTIVDVLGQVADPLALLRNMRRQVRSSGLLFAAELCAHPVQELVAPVRRAFTRSELSQLLELAGWEPVQWLECESEFVGCLACCRSGDAYHLLEAGDMAWQRGDHDEANAQFEAVARGGDRALTREARLRQGTMHEELGMFREASGCYFEVKASAPEEPRGRALLARLQARLGRGFEALELARSAVELDPANRIAITCLAAVAEEIEHPEALSAWRIAHALAPDNAAVGGAFAQHLVHAGEAAEAAQVLARVASYVGQSSVTVALGLPPLAERSRPVSPKRVA